MSAREAIAEAFCRGITITLRNGRLFFDPEDKIDSELGEALFSNAPEIALLVGGKDIRDKRRHIVKIIRAREVRSALASIVFQKMGVRVTDPQFYVNLMNCSADGDVRVEIRANVEPGEESWKGTL